MRNIDIAIFEELKNHSEVSKILSNELSRANNTIELIASENFCSDAVRAAAASSAVWKYAEGYPAGHKTGNKGRYYGGCGYIDELEEYCCDKWKEVFGTEYHVNVQPHSGSQANYAAFAAVIKPGDTILSLSLNNGGHLTHGSSANFSGKLYNIVEYGVDDSGYINYEDIYNKVRECKPQLVLAGASAYPRAIDFEKIAHIIDNAYGSYEANTLYETRPYFMVDMSHIAGLVAAGDHPSPFGFADIITTTTHKTLRGTRGGLIFCVPYLAKKIDSAVFPGSQGGPLPHIIAAKAVTADEACTGGFKEYIHAVVLNAKVMADEFVKLGYDVVTGGTDNHMFLIDLTNTGLSGKEVQDELDKHNITLNKNCVPNEKRSPQQTSGVRIGTAAMTTRGFSEEDFIHTAHVIDSIIRKMRDKT